MAASDHDPPGPRLWKLSELTEKERESMTDLRAQIDAWAGEERGDVATDDHTLLRFLVARGFQVGAALQMYQQTVEWRRQKLPHLLLEEPRASELVENRRMKAVWWRESDAFGRPVCLGWAARHLKSFPALEEKLDHALWALESGAARCAAHERYAEGGAPSYFVVLADLTGLGMANVDYAFFQEMINVMQQYYPERLGAFYVCNAGWLFSVIWKVVKPWLDKRTAQKIFVNPSRDDLLRLLPAEHLPRSFGGDADDTDFGKQLPPDAPKP